LFILNEINYYKDVILFFLNNNEVKISVISELQKYNYIKNFTDNDVKDFTINLKNSELKINQNNSYFKKIE
jgi:hypothetical protein